MSISFQPKRNDKNSGSGLEQHSGPITNASSLSKKKVLNKAKKSYGHGVSMLRHSKIMWRRSGFLIHLTTYEMKQWMIFSRHTPPTLLQDARHFWWNIAQKKIASNRLQCYPSIRVNPVANLCFSLRWRPLNLFQPSLITIAVLWWTGWENSISVF